MYALSYNYLFTWNLEQWWDLIIVIPNVGNCQKDVNVQKPSKKYSLQIWLPGMSHDMSGFWATKSRYINTHLLTFCDQKLTTSLVPNDLVKIKGR